MSLKKAKNDGAKTARSGKENKASEEFHTVIRQVTFGGRGADVTIEGAKLIKCAIREPIESEFKGTLSYNYVAGLLLNDIDAVHDLVAQIKEHFRSCKTARDVPGWAEAALAHFDAKKFRLTDDGTGYILFPAAPAEKTASGGFQPLGRVFISPSVDAFYPGCIVDAKIAFVANTKGAYTIKDYLNGLRFVKDGEKLGAVDPWGDSVTRWESAGSVKSDRAESAHSEDDEPPTKAKRGIGKLFG